MASSVPSAHSRGTSWEHSSVGAQGGGEEGWLSHDTDTCPAWNQRADGAMGAPLRGGVHGLLLLSVLCQHSCSRGLVLNQSLFLSPAVLSFRLIRAAQGLSSWLCPGCGNICTNMALQRTSGKEWRWRDVRGESRDLLLGVGIQPCT